MWVFRIVEGKVVVDCDVDFVCVKVVVVDKVYVVGCYDG